MIQKFRFEPTLFERMNKPVSRCQLIIRNLEFDCSMPSLIYGTLPLSHYHTNRCHYCVTQILAFVDLFISEKLVFSICVFSICVHAFGFSLIPRKFQNFEREVVKLARIRMSDEIQSLVR